jgi:hypothetical protein
MKEMGQEKILNYTIRDLKIEELCPNSINGVIVSIVNNKSEIDLPPNMTSEFFRKWIRGTGGMFSRDVSKHAKGKKSAKYILMEGEGERSILRLIDDEELELFESLKLIDGKVKDKPYMLLKNLAENQSLTTYDRYIEETPESVLPEEETELPNTMPPISEVSEGRPTALFND